MTNGEYYGTSGAGTVVRLNGNNGLRYSGVVYMGPPLRRPFAPEASYSLKDARPATRLLIDRVTEAGQAVSLGCHGV